MRRRRQQLISTLLPPRGPQLPGYLDREAMALIHVLDHDWGPYATRDFVMVCSVAGISTRMFALHWKARTIADAEQTFWQWVLGDRGVLDRMFHPDEPPDMPAPRRWHMRPTLRIDDFYVLEMGDWTGRYHRV